MTISWQLAVLRRLFPTQEDKEQQQQKQRLAYSEDRLLQAVTVLIEDLNTIDKWKGYLAFLKGEILQQWLKSFATEFHSETTNGIVYDNEMFAQFVKDTVAYSRGLRSGNERGSNAEETLRQGGNCIIM